jgi:hypothetical protein
MQSHQNNNRWLGKKVFLLSIFFVVCGFIIGLHSEGRASDGIYASVLEIKGMVQSQAPDGKAELVKPGDFINMGDKLNLGQESWVVLMMADSTIRKFSGPATITIREESKGDDENVLARLGSAIVELLFAREEGDPEVAMVTRLLDKLPEEQKGNLPLTIYPVGGSGVVGTPKRFEWRKIEGVPLYRVAVYSWDRLMWQDTTSDSYIQCPAEKCVFIPGERYYWGVEALVGNTSLRSKGAVFKILPEGTDQQLIEEFKRIDSSCSDTVLCNLIKVRLLLALDLYRDALELLNSPFVGAAPQAEIHQLRAEILGMMGLYEEAFREYHKAIGR